MTHIFGIKSQGKTTETLDSPVLLFDGECMLCNTAVQWIVQREKDELLHFASLSSEKAKALLQSAGLKEYADSIVYVDRDGSVFLAHDAAFKVIKHLRRSWQWLKLFQCVPRGLRSAVYTWIAKNRIQWFGSVEHCALLTDFDKSRLHA